MTPRQVRSKIAVVTTALGLAVLLAGPASTFGLGVPVVGSTDSTTTAVTNTVQTVADTTQQTAATTVTNVESTTQTTVQTTTQAVASQPAATTQPATTTKQTTTTTSAPARKQATAVSAPRTVLQRAATTKTELAKRAGGASAAPVRVAKRTRVAHSRKAAASAPTTTATSTTAADPPSSCAVSELSLLPGGAELQALLSIVCAATGGIDLPARLGLVSTTQGTPSASGDARGASAHAPTGPLHARAAANGVHALSRTAQPPSAGAAQASHPGAPLSPAGASGRGAGRVFMYAAADPSAGVPTSANAGPQAAANATDHHHHAWFSGQASGTAILTAIIIANIAILAGIALWRAAVRWVIPRFA
jgi:hypothetical protein